MNFKYLSFASLCTSALLLALPALSHVCSGDNKSLPLTDYTLKEVDHNLTVLSNIFTSAGKKRTVTQVLDNINRNLTEAAPSGFQSEAWAQQEGNAETTEWYPQGISSSGDAYAVGTFEGRDVWLVSWYKEAMHSRISFIDRENHQYRHVLLVQKDGEDNFKGVPIHVGGIAWYGKALYTVDTNNGLRVFDLDNIWEVESGDGIGKKDGGGYSAAGYKYVLPQNR